jgi:TrpR-related protein YerC/YecD
MENSQNTDVVRELFEAMLSIKDEAEMARFMKDLCTPQEISALAERWRVCRLLNEGDLSYREIHDVTGASLATITRVARFLKDEPHHGYRSVLQKMTKKKMKK